MVVAGLYADSSATINLEEGKISGNTVLNKLTEVKQDNVYVTHTVVKLILRGNIEIEDITINAAGSASNNVGFIVVSGELTDEIILNLRGTTSNTTAETGTAVAAWWLNKTVLKGASGYDMTASDVEKFRLGHFLNDGTTGTGSPGPTSNYKIDETGRLVKNNQPVSN